MSGVFLGIVTVPERRLYFDQVLDGCHHFESLVPEVAYHVDADHEGPGHSKNVLLRRALETDADWFFIGEDDVVPQSPKAITGYLAAAEASGWEHLAFAHHGLGNARGPVEKDAWVSIYPHYVGAWCLYSRRSIETCGLMDEAFVGSWDHVEHTLRLSLAGFHPLPPEPFALRAADATGSEDWLAEIPGSIDNTALPHTPEWQVNQVNGRRYWKETYPESYRLVFSR